MDRKRGNSLFYWRMFSIVLIILIVLALLIIPLLLSGQFNFFKVLLKDVSVLLSPESNESFGIDILNASEVNATESMASFAERPMIGKPVQWVKTAKVEGETGVILFPKEAENIVVKKTMDLEGVGEIKTEGESGEIAVNESIVNETILNESKGNETILNESEEVIINNSEENASNITEANNTGENITDENNFMADIFGADLELTGGVISGRAGEEIVESEVVEKENSKEVIVNGFAEYKIEYSTPAPSIIEEVKSKYRKKVVVSGPELGYENILTFTSIPEILPVGRESSIKVYWVEQGTYEPFTAYDSNGNGMLDYVEWNTPHLSEQTFEIILITKAEHLDENRIFVEDAYEKVKERDNVWEEIPEGDYLRVTFERNLTSEKDITIYARSSSGAGIEVYEKDGGEKIADFGSIGEDKEYKVYLSNLIGEQNTFDLLVKGGSAEFDYVVDPPIGNCGILNTENEIYTLTNNVSSTEICFNVTAEHITIDCQGYEINYSYGAISGYGVYSNANFTAVKNCIVKEGTNATNNKHAIYFYEANNGTIDNNTITTSGAGSYGIYLNVNASFNNISSNNVITSGSTANGIVLTSSSANTLPSNTITINNASAYGILINNSDNIFLINNFIRSNGSDVWLHGLSGGMGVSNVSIIGNNLLGNYRGAIYLDGVVSSTNIFNNTIFTYGINVPGIYASFGSFNQTNIESNLIHTERASSDAVSIFNGRGVNITNNNVTTNGSASNGFRLRAGSDLKINDNKIITFNSTSISIYLMQGTNSSIINNNSITTFGASTYGIVLSAGKNNTFNNNLIKTYGFSGHGIAIFGSLNNTLNNNSILTHNNSAMGLLFASFSDSIIMSGMDIRTNSSVFAYPIYIDGAHNFTITDSVLNASFGLQELFVSAAANGGEWNFTNVTRGDGVSSFRRMWETGANGILNAHWYVNAYANYTNVSIAPNANISAWNVDDLRRFSEFTNESDGRIARQTLLEYKQSSDISLTYYSNYTFNATSLLIGGEELSQSWNISTNRNLGFMFKEEIILPNINFTEPTPPNGSVISRSYALINVSIVEQNLKEAIFNWNGTNYSIYDDSLLLMYNFENLSSLGENDSFVRDVSRYGNNGIVYGSMKWIPNGRFGGAFKMNGTASAEEYIQIADSTLFRVASKTISFWLNKSDESFSKIFNLASQNYGFGLDGFETEVTWLDASEAPAFCGQSLFIPLGVWSYYSLVFNVTGSQVNTTLYIDGRAVSSCQNNLGYSSNYGSSFIIGKYGSMTFFNGSIDEFRFWNRALTLEEINQLYFTSLHKQNNTNWELFVNQGKNSTNRLDFGNYSYFAAAEDMAGNKNRTETRTISVFLNLAPFITQIFPINGQKIAPLSYTYLNFSLDDDNDESMEFFVFGTNLSSDRLSEFLLYHRKNISDGNFSYLWRGMPVDPLSGGLTALYHFDNRSRPKESDTLVYDWSGNQNNGSMEGGAIWNETGKFAGNFEFDGANNDMKVDNSDSLSIRNNLTITMWVKRAGSGREGLVIKRNAYYFNFHDDNRLRFYKYTGGATSESYSVAAITDTNWHHVAVTYNGTTTSFYIDGNLNSFSLQSGLIDTNLEPIYVGSYYGAPYFKGTIDEVAIWNRSLTGSEIKSLALLEPSIYYWEVNASDGKKENSLTTFFKIAIPPFTSRIILNSSFGTNTTDENLTCYAEAFDSPASDEYISAYWRWYNGSQLFSQGVTDMRSETDFNYSMMLFLHFNNDSLYKENDTFIYDFSGRGHNASSVFSSNGLYAPKVINGSFDKAFNLSWFNDAGQSNTHLKIKDNDELSLEVNASITIWVYYVDPGTEDHEILAHKGGTGAGYTFGVTDDTVAGSGQGGGTYPRNRVRFDYKTSAGGSNDHYSNSVVTPKTWHFIGLVREENKIKFYLDGIFDGERPFNAAPDNNMAIINPSSDMWIGDSVISGDVNEEWNGAVDELVLWNRSLSSSEMTGLYEKSKGVRVLKNITLLDANYTAVGNTWNCSLFMANQRDNETEDNNVSIRILGSIPLKIADIEIGNANINPGGLKDVHFSVIVRTSEMSSLNKVNASFSISSIIKKNESCVRSEDIDSVTANYSCTIGIWYFEQPGEWKVDTFVNDTFGQSDDYNETFILMSEASVTHQGNLSWGVLSVGTSPNRVVDLLLNNTGNTAFSSISVTANNLMRQPSGAEYIPAANIKVHNANSGTSCTAGTQMSAGLSILIPGTSLPIGNNSMMTKDAASGQEELFNCLTQVPIGLPSAEYAAKDANSWQLTLS